MSTLQLTVKALLSTSTILFAATMSYAAPIDISGEINIDDVVTSAAGDSGRLIGTTRSVWSSGGFSVPIDLNGNTLEAFTGGNSGTVYAGAISGDGTVNFVHTSWWSPNWNDTYEVSGTQGNTYTGNTNVTSARLILNKSNGFALSGTVTVGDTSVQQNASGNARVQWNANNQISNASDVIVLPKLHNEADLDNATYLILNGFTDTFKSLTLIGDAHVRTDGDGGVGALTVTALTYDDGDGNLTHYVAGTYTSSDVSFITGSGSITVIPEPASLVLMGLGGMMLCKRRR